MDIINAIPFFPLLAVSLFMGILFYAGHLLKIRNCDHGQVEFYRLVHDPKKGTYSMEVKCYCGKDVDTVLRTEDMTEWGYAFITAVNASKRSLLTRIVLTFGHLVLLLVGAVFVLIRCRDASMYFYDHALYLEDLLDGDLEKWKYIDRRDERLSKFMDNLHLIDTVVYR